MDEWTNYTDRQTKRQTDKWLDANINAQSNVCIDRQTKGLTQWINGLKYVQIEGLIEVWTDVWMERQTESLSDRQRDG